ncbi:hypothetical protein GCM10009037_26530 [Halarchaeum grantii]|uniref:Uncharacterized protein n=1 Tax=Halarchaeum grantii TaxID=1193105 RepID=A0A830FCL2_9EURY|nr:hypothetical protein [Halarchaeum grantii]GGL41623.1 hypothetical protein GCM10009037_26530 [Halarchaeum grantii]
MEVPTVSDVEDIELYDRLEHRSPEVLCRVFNHFYFENGEEYCDPDEYDSKGWRRLLAGALPQETRAWLQTHAQIANESVDRVHAVAHLNETYDVPEEKRGPDTLYELAILIHELGLEERLPQLIVSARIKQNEMKRTWVLQEEIPLSNLSEKIDSFQQSWNKREDRTKAVLVQQELSDKSVASLQIFAEKGAGVTEELTFGFREGEQDGDTDIPERPELSTVRYRELKQIRVLLKVESGRTLVVFTDEHRRGWTSVLNGFFEHAFDIESITNTIEKQTVTEAAELREEAHESVDFDDNPIEKMAGLINDRSEAALDAVDNSPHGAERKQRLKTKIQNIELSGSEIEDDPNLGTEEFRLIGRTNLDEVFKQVDIEDGFFQFLDRASNESLALVLNVDGRHVAARKTGPQSVDGSRLGSETQVALTYFFDQEGVL